MSASHRLVALRPWWQQVDVGETAYGWVGPIYSHDGVPVEDVSPSLDDYFGALAATYAGFVVDHPKVAVGKPRVVRCCGVPDCEGRGKPDQATCADHPKAWWWFAETAAWDAKSIELLKRQWHPSWGAPPDPKESPA